MLSLLTAALHNHAGLYGSDVAPPPGADANTSWASGAWFIGPDGATLTQMPSSTQKGDSREFVLVQNVPIRGASDCCVNATFRRVQPELLRQLK